MGEDLIMLAGHSNLKFVDISTISEQVSELYPRSRLMYLQYDGNINDTCPLIDMVSMFKPNLIFLLGMVDDISKIEGPTNAFRIGSGVKRRLEGLCESMFQFICAIKRRVRDVVVLAQPTRIDGTMHQLCSEYVNLYLREKVNEYGYFLAQLIPSLDNWYPEHNNIYYGTGSTANCDGINFTGDRVSSVISDRVYDIVIEIMYFQVEE